MARTFKTSDFKKWADKEGITDQCLLNAVDEMNRGLVDAEICRNVVKKRVAREGQGKRGSYRTLLAFRANDKAFYIFGFAKNDRENINNSEKDAIRALADEFFAMTEQQIQRSIEAMKLYEVTKQE